VTTAAASPLILFYNRVYPGFGDPTKGDCGGACGFTSDLGCLSQANAIVFHIPTLRGVPLPRRHAGQRWVAWSLESDVNYPELADPAFMRQFEITMTYWRDATVWWAYFESDTAEALLKPSRPKTESSPVVYFRSSSVDRCGRTAYAAALMRRVKVDTYGSVLRNRDLPEPDKGRETLLAVTARYKFALVLENSRSEDYVSEKLFWALMRGSMPVYRGAPNIAAFAPAGRCFINAADFAGSAELAAYLYSLNEHDGANQEYLAWKCTGLSPGFQTLVDSVRFHALCRLCDHLRRTAPLDDL
jgi:alpha-1,3-fucosyltransferase 10